MGSGVMRQALLGKARNGWSRRVDNWRGGLGKVGKGAESFGSARLGLFGQGARGAE